MSFDEWHKKHSKFIRQHDIDRWLEIAWQTAVQEERNACARIGDTAFLETKESKSFIRGWERSMHDYQFFILERSKHEKPKRYSPVGNL